MNGYSNLQGMKNSFMESDNSSANVVSAVCSHLQNIAFPCIVRHEYTYVGEQFEHNAITIYDRPTDANIIGYHRLHPNTTADIEQLLAIQSSGKKIRIISPAFLFKLQSELALGLGISSMLTFGPRAVRIITRLFYKEILYY